MGEWSSHDVNISSEQPEFSNGHELILERIKTVINLHWYHEDTGRNKISVVSGAAMMSTFQYSAEVVISLQSISMRLISRNYAQLLRKFSFTRNYAVVFKKRAT